MKPMLLTLFSFLLSLPLLSMPTAEEIAAAEPLVQEVMKAEMDALRSGKKTREQVGDAAVAEDAERVNHGLHRIRGKRRRMMFSRVERVERVEGQSGIICGI